MRCQFSRPAPNPLQGHGRTARASIPSTRCRESGQQVKEGARWLQSHARSVGVRRMILETPERFLKASRRWRARQDLNLRPLGPQPNALSRLSYGRETWSGQRDSNPRSPAWQAGILPLNYGRSDGAPYDSTTNRAQVKSWATVGWSRRRESNPQPTDYKSVALPLSYCGASLLYLSGPLLQPARGRLRDRRPDAGRFRGGERPVHPDGIGTQGPSSRGRLPLQASQRDRRALPGVYAHWAGKQRRGGRIRWALREFLQSHLRIWKNFPTHLLPALRRGRALASKGNLQVAGAVLLRWLPVRPTLPLEEGP